MATTLVIPRITRLSFPTDNRGETFRFTPEEVTEFRKKYPQAFKRPVPSSAAANPPAQPARAPAVPKRLQIATASERVKLAERKTTPSELQRIACSIGSYAAAPLAASNEAKMRK